MIASRISRRTMGSRPDDGSSRTNNSGRCVKSYQQSSSRTLTAAFLKEGQGPTWQFPKIPWQSFSEYFALLVGGKPVGGVSRTLTRPNSLSNFSRQTENVIQNELF